jgi:hypothetical protein
MDKRIERMLEREKALSHEYLTKVLEYEPESGVFIWKIRASQAVKPGDIAGSVNKNGYLFIKVGKYIYRAHRLAWFYFYGQWPPIENYQIDHIDGNRLNNSIKNLRLASNAKNARNHKLYSHNTSGVSGVHFAEASNKWKATIRYNGRNIHLGYYASFEDAVNARIVAEKELGYTTEKDM